MSREDNKYYQLKDDLKSGELTLRLVECAIRHWVDENKKVPEGVKDLLTGKGIEGSSGLIGKQFMCIAGMIGNMELAYRRGGQKPLKEK